MYVDNSPSCSVCAVAIPLPVPYHGKAVHSRWHQITQTNDKRVSSLSLLPNDAPRSGTCCDAPPISTTARQRPPKHASRVLFLLPHARKVHTQNFPEQKRNGQTSVSSSFARPTNRHPKHRHRHRHRPRPLQRQQTYFLRGLSPSFARSSFQNSTDPVEALPPLPPSSPAVPFLGCLNNLLPLGFFGFDNAAWTPSSSLSFLAGLAESLPFRSWLSSRGGVEGERDRRRLRSLAGLLLTRLSRPLLYSYLQASG